jgi:hypothetical protein
MSFISKFHPLSSGKEEVSFESRRPASSQIPSR